MFKRNLVIWVIFIGMCLSSQGCENKQKNATSVDYGLLNPQKDFTLTDQDGHIFQLKDHRGQVILLFFGYLACPDVCPTMLSKLTRVYKLLGTQGDKVLTVFISLDPERDTPQKLKEYLEYFKIKSTGLTGTKSEIDAVAKVYGASYEKVYTEGKDYLMNHSDYLYLIDTQGRTSYLFHPEDKAEKIVSMIQKL